MSLEPWTPPSPCSVWKGLGGRERSVRKGLGGRERSGTPADHSQPAGPDACPRLPWSPPSGRMSPAGLLCGPCTDNTRWLIIHPPRAGHGGREPIRTQLQSVGSFREGRRGRTEVSEGTTDALLSHAFLAGTEETKRPQEAPPPHQELLKTQETGTHPQFDPHSSRYTFHVSYLLGSW